jgi:MOSC domain-containing protein YiiM
MNKPVGTVVSIHTAATNGVPLTPLDNVSAVPGRGLEGDRHFEQLEKPPRKRGAGRDVTLIEMEALEALKRDYDVDLPLGDTRRNIVTTGVALNHLVGREFLVGTVRLHGAELCEPCGHLAKLTSDKASRALVHRGGLRCDILTQGVIRVGDAITVP